MSSVAPTIAPSSGRGRDDREPGDRAAPRAALVQHEGDRVQAVREVVRDDGEEDEHARRRVEAEREADPEPVDEGVDRERCLRRARRRGCARAPPRARRGGAGRASRSTRKKPTKPAPTSIPTRRGSSRISIASGSTWNSATATTTPPVSAIAVVRSRLRRSAASPAAERREHGDEREGNRDPGHAQRAQSP